LGPKDPQLIEALFECGCALLESNQRDAAKQFIDRAATDKPPAGRIPTGSVQKGSVPMGSVLQGQAIRRVEPIYPNAAKQARISGSVVVELTVDECGKAINARAISGHPLLADAAMKAALEWRFTPTRVDGTRIKVIGAITFNFHL